MAWRLAPIAFIGIPILVAVGDRPESAGVAFGCAIIYYPLTLLSLWQVARRISREAFKLAADEGQNAAASKFAPIALSAAICETAIKTTGHRRTVVESVLMVLLVLNLVSLLAAIAVPNFLRWRAANREQQTLKASAPAFEDTKEIPDSTKPAFDPDAYLASKASPKPTFDPTTARPVDDEKTAQQAEGGFAAPQRDVDEYNRQMNAEQASSPTKQPFDPTTAIPVDMSKAKDWVWISIGLLIPLLGLLILAFLPTKAAQPQQATIKLTRASPTPPPPPPPPPPHNPMAKFYLHLSNEVKGPFTTEQIRALLECGTASLETQCCKEGSQDWQTVQRFL